MKRNITLLLLLLLQINGNTQVRSYLGIEANIAGDRIKLEDPGQHVAQIPLIGPFVGLTFRQELTPHFFLETGFFYKSYPEGIGFRNDRSYSLSDGFYVFAAPLRAGRYVPLLKNRIRFVPTIGMVFANNQYYNEVGGSGMSGWNKAMNGDSTTFSYTTDYKRGKFFLFQTGGDLAFTIAKKAMVSLKVHYYSGLTTVSEQDISYSINTDPVIRAKGTSKGQFLSIGFGFQYPISGAWQRNE